MCESAALDNPPREAVWEFSPEEFRRRVQEARRRMAGAGIDCLFLTSEKNIRYLTGFHTQIWVSPTRPRYLLLPLRKEAVAIVPATNVYGFRRTTWITDIRSWPAPRPEDDGISLVLDALRGFVPAGGKLGAEIGPEMRVEMPVRDFLRIRDGLDDGDVVDAGQILRPLRMRKSPEEVERIRRAAEIGSEGFARLPAMVHVGQSEREVYRRLHLLLVELGADKVPYLLPASGPSGYEQVNMGPSDRVLGRGDLLFVDVGLTSHGYFCDFDRNFAIGEPTAELREAYARVFAATEAGLQAVRPGKSAAEVWQAMAAVLGPDGGMATPIGRMGHGLGLDITEPPSMAPGDGTLLEAGMVLTLEPSLVLPPAAGLGRRLMVHEENLVVTERGCRLLTRRAAPELPVVS